MIAETAAIAFTVKALIGIICGSVGGGLLFGGTAGYLIARQVHSSKADIEKEYRELDKEASFRRENRKQSLESTYHRVAKISKKTMSAIASNQKRASSAIDGLEKTIDSAAEQQQSGRTLIDATLQESEVIKRLMAELKAKTDQLAQLTTNYDLLNTKFSAAVNKLEDALAELEFIKTTFCGERDYTAQVIKKIKSLKSTNADLQKSLDLQTEKYNQAEQQILTMTGYLNQARSTILAQEKIIADLEMDKVDLAHKTGKSTASNLTFF